MDNLIGIGFYHPVEFRDNGELHGVAMNYGETGLIGSLQERFEKGSLEPAERIVLNLRHDPRKVLVSTPELQVDFGEEAVTFKAMLPAYRVAELRETRELGASIEFLALKSERESGVRVVSRAVLAGIALTPNPAYRGTSVSVREDENPWRLLL